MDVTNPVKDNTLELEMGCNHNSKEFKLDAISLVLEQGYSRAEAARILETNANMLRRWLREYEAPEGQAFWGSGSKRPAITP